MPLPFDIEDIIGAGCLATITRSLAGLSCIWMGSMAGVMALLTAELVLDLVGGYGWWFDFDLWNLIAAPVWWLMTSWGFLGIAMAIGTFFYLHKADGGSVRVWIAIASGFGLLTVVAQVHGEAGLEFWPAYPLLVGFLGALAFVAVMGVNWQRKRFGEHLMGIAAENEDRRREQEGKTGSAGGDSEFATGTRPEEWTGRGDDDS